MKKLLRLIALIALIVLPIKVCAAGGVTINPTSLSIQEGSSATFTIKMTNTIGDATISSNNTGVATVSTGFWETGMIEANQEKSVTVTVSGKTPGTATITILLDGATFDADPVDISGTRTIAVTVTPKPADPPSGGGGSTGGNTGGNTGGAATPDNRSSNNQLKSISIEGYTLNKIDNKNYSLTVPNNVTSVKISATAEDSKAKVTGAGSRNINVGDNNLEVVITAENGSQNKINVKVTRKDAYYMEDLDTALKEEKQEDINISIKPDTKISSKELNTIKESQKEVKFNYYDDNKKLIYSWIVDGSKIVDFDVIETSITFDSEKVNEISKLANYAEGAYVNLKQEGSLPSGTKVSIFIGDKYKDDDILNVYHYNEAEQKMDLVQLEASIKNGYIEFDAENGADYLITKATILENGEVIMPECENDNGNKTLVIILVIIIALLVAALCFVIFKNSKKKTNDDNDKITPIAPIVPEKKVEVEQHVEEVKVPVQPVQQSTPVQQTIETVSTPVQAPITNPENIQNRVQQPVFPKREIETLEETKTETLDYPQTSTTTNNNDNLNN